MGRGSFGRVYRGKDISTGDRVALKMERANVSRAHLPDEARIYRELGVHEGIPRCMWFGREGSHRVLVMQLLGPSLGALFARCQRRFSVHTVLLLGDQMLRLLRTVHAGGYVHRDIKPDNFLMGTGSDARAVHIIDFGLARRYRDPKTGKHVERRGVHYRRVLGTARYASVNAHLGKEQSRRDDIQALGHVLIYFARGGLPWQGLERRHRDSDRRRRAVLAKMLDTRVGDLVAGLPAEFGMYVRYARGLKFDEEPDYEMLQGWLHRALLREEAAGACDRATGFDWEKPA